MIDAYKGRIGLALKRLEEGTTSLYLLRNKLIENINEKFDDVVINNTYTTISTLEDIFSFLYSNLSSILYIYEIVMILEDAVKLLDSVKDDMYELIPYLELKLDEIVSKLEEITTMLRINDQDTSNLELPYINDED